jgi:hypothetical protein
MPYYDHFVKIVLWTKSRTSTKMKHLGGLVCWWRCSWGSPRASRLVEDGVNLGSTLVDCHLGLKRLLCLLCFRVLPVQPYDTMGSVLIEYVVRVHPWVLIEGDSRIVGGYGQARLVECFFRKVLSHFTLWVGWVLRWKCTTPVGCKSNQLAVSPVMDILSL